MVNEKSKAVDCAGDKEKIRLKDGTSISRKDRKLAAEWSFAKPKLDDFNPANWSKETYNKYKDDYLGGKVSYETWERYVEENNKNKEVLNTLRELILIKIAAKKPRDATELLVESFRNENYIYSTRDDEKSEMWIYRDGIYIPEGKSFIREYCRWILGEAYTKYISNEVITKIEADTFIDKDEFFKTKDIYEIPIIDGILNIKTRIVSSFTPEKIFFNKLPLNYVPNQKCDKIKTFFQDILSHPDDVNIMFEIFGFLLLKDYRIEKAIMFNGDGRNGKGKTLRLMEKFVGDRNCCNVGLSSMRKDNFDLEDLFGKLVNLAGDTGKTALKDTGCFKELVGRDGVNLPRKFKRSIRFINYAKHIFACNELPVVYDDTDGFWTKWVLLDFPFKFITKTEYNNLSTDEKRKKKIIDTDILEKISTQEELNGLLNKALDGLDGILNRGDFSYTTGSSEVKRTWKRRANSFTAFCEDYIIEDYDGKVSKIELRREYLNYCKKYKLVTRSGEKQIKYILENNFSVEEARNMTMDGRLSFWRGIRLNFSGQDDQDGQGISPPREIATSPRDLKTLVSLASLAKQFESLKNMNFMITKNKIPTELILKKSHIYNENILGDNPQDILKILLKNKDIKLT